MYLVKFQISDGTVIGNRYRSSVGMAQLFGLALQGDFLVFTTYYSSNYIVAVWNTITYEFTIKNKSNGYTYQAITESSSGR